MSQQAVSDAIVRHFDHHAATLQRKAREYEAAGTAGHAKDAALLADALLTAAAPHRAQCPHCKGRNTGLGSGTVSGIDTTYRVCDDCSTTWDAQ